MSTKSASSRDLRPRYGVDAPGVMWGLLGSGLGFLLLGFACRVFFRVPWTAWTLQPVFFVAAGVLLFLFSCMTAYALNGKIRQRDFMLSRVQWRGDEQVLDIGTGRGLLLVGAAKRLKTGKAIGIDVWRSEDLSANTPDAARRNAELEGVASLVEVRDGDARDLAFADDSIDVVLSLLCIHNIEPEEGRVVACREIARVLKLGGTALIGDYLPTHNYAKTLAEAGLHVVSSRSYFGTALGLMWMVEAVKPE